GLGGGGHKSRQTIGAVSAVVTVVAVGAVAAGRAITDVRGGVDFTGVERRVVVVVETGVDACAAICAVASVGLGGGGHKSRETIDRGVALVDAIAVGAAAAGGAMTDERGGGGFAGGEG